MTDIEYGYPKELATRREREAAGTGPALLQRLANWVVLFQYKDFIFVTYGLFGGLGALAGLTWMALVLLGQGLSRSEFALLAVIGSLAILLSSRVAALVLDYREVLADPLRALRTVAFVSWGGIVAVPFILIGFSAASGRPLLLLMDATALAVPLGHAIGRVGCISYGCCFGRPTRGTLAVRYHDPQAKAVRLAGLGGVPLHPTPLYEGAWNLGLFALLNALAFLGAPQGVPATLYLLLYGLGRFATEFFRDNQGRMVWGPLAVNHLLALVLAVSGAAFLPVVLLAFPADAADISLARSGREVLPLLPLFALCGAAVFLGFALHRRRIGQW